MTQSQKKAKQKILFISATEYAIEQFAGPYIAALSDAGYEMHVVTGKEIGNYVAPKGVIRKSVSLSRKPSPLSDLKQCFALVSYMKKHKFSSVYTISPKGGLVGQLSAKLSGIPMRIHFFTGQVWKTRQGLYRNLLKNLDRLIGSMVSQAYIDSASQAEFLIEEKVLDRCKAVVLGSGSVSGILVENYAYSSENRELIRSRHGFTDSNIVVFFLGRISKVKGVKDLVAAFALAYADNQDLRLLIVGPDDGDLENVKATISEKGMESLIAAEWESTPRPAIHYSAAEIFCVPSYMEGFGNVVLESACAGVPTIGSNIYGLQDAIVDNETGLLYEPGNIRELSEKILRLANDPELRVRMGENAYKRTRDEFSQAYLVQKFIEAHNAYNDVKIQ